MTNSTLHLADVNVSDVSAAELRDVNGGAIAWVAVGIAVGGFIVANWPDIKQGFSDGWNS